MKTISTEKYTIYIGNDSITEINRLTSNIGPSSVFILVDENTKKHCLPVVKREAPLLQKAKIISIKSGEKNKNIRSCEKIWKELSGQNADRKSLLVNLGGGVISDLGGFAASTYKRGINFINIPTTLLAQVDASTGGKTGINFFDFKNQVGVFAFPRAVFIYPAFLKSLNQRELSAGFSEVIKHGLVADKDYWKQIQASSSALPLGKRGISTEIWDKIILRSVQIKNDIVSKDPYENGLRKALNFGHTIGHAIESASLRSKKKMLHGEAIAAGIICEAFLSRKYCGLSSEELDLLSKFIISNFNPKPVNYPAKQLISLMKQDKKNKDSEINFTLLSAIGKAEINNPCSEELIEEAIHFLNALCR